MPMPRSRSIPTNSSEIASTGVPSTMMMLVA